MLPGKAARQCKGVYQKQRMVQYAESMVKLDINVPRTTTTTKQNLDPRCTYVPTRVKSQTPAVHNSWTKKAIARKRKGCVT
jgi:hypothetical protein